MSDAKRFWNVVAMVLAAIALHKGDAVSQLVTDAEPMEACEVRNLSTVERHIAESV